MRTVSRSLSVAVAVVALTAIPATAQMDARNEPRVSGPLRREVRRCQQRSQEFRGRVVARAESCVRLYAFRPGSERDQRRDYGVIWLQTELRTEPNWCATRALSDIRIPSVARPHARAPRVARATEARRYVVRLRVDANGNARRAGSIAKGFTLFPRVYRGRMMSATRTYRATWEGNTGRTLAFASGVEISWREGDPPARLATGLRFRLLRSARC